MEYAIKHFWDRDRGTRCKLRRIFNEKKIVPYCPYKPADELEIVHPLCVSSAPRHENNTTCALTDWQKPSEWLT